ncbi:MAG TPA: GNAT family N-acetyltransferase [Ktedonobacterales bacterium]
MIQDSIEIRPAQPGDAGVAAMLLYSAYTHSHVTYPPREASEGWVERLQAFFRQDGNRFSYQHIQVAGHGADVVGLVLSFGGRDEPRLNAAIGPWLEREAEDDEWYVDALAVLENWSRQGIGMRLMQTAERQARQHSYAEIALNVALGNTEAVNLYTRLHYIVTRETVIYGRPHVRMVKTLKHGDQGSGAAGSA